MSTLVNYIEPVKFKSFEAARSEWSWVTGSWPCQALPGLIPSLHLPRKEQVLRDVILRGDQGNGATDQESHGVCGVSSPGTGARVGGAKQGLVNASGIGPYRSHLHGVLSRLVVAWAALLEVGS